jgi:anthranilate phosphoribosyltransferase
MSITPNEALGRCIDHREIFHDEMLSLWRRLMSGDLTPVQIAGLLVGLRVKKETIGEIAAAAQIMREFSTKVVIADHSHLVDIVGTGGDGANTFNISTAAMFVAAAAGARIAKHGNRSVSSSSGSADVLESLGARIALAPEQVAACLDQTGIGFMFAPNHHAAMRHAGPVRKELGVRTIFNILGPLTNPAGAPNQLMGVFHPDLVGIQVRVLERLGSRHVLVVHGKDGMDEVSLGAAGRTARRRRARIRDTSRGLRPVHGVAPRVAGGQRARIARQAARGDRRHARAGLRNREPECRCCPLCRRLRRIDSRGHCHGALGNRRRRRPAQARALRCGHECAGRWRTARCRLACPGAP